jgi:Fe-S oxidoreductase
MNNKDLITQYATTSGRDIGEYQREKLNPNQLKSYIRQRVLAHNSDINANYRYNLLNSDELKLAINLGFNPNINLYSFDNVNDLRTILSNKPEMISSVSKEQINKLPSIFVYLLLKEHPSLIKYLYKVTNKDDEWGKDYGILLVSLHSSLYPYFKKDFIGKDIYDISNVIELKPELLPKLINDGIINYEMMNKSLFKSILKDNYSLLKQLPDVYLSIFDNYDITKILIKYPKFIKKLLTRFLAESDNYNIVSIIEKQPKLASELINHINNKLYINTLIEDNPSFYPLLNDENKRNIYDYTIYDIIEKNPKTKKYFIGREGLHI